MAAPYVVCRKPCGAYPDYPAVLTVLGRFCSPCYQAGRDPAASLPADVRTFRAGGKALGLRVASVATPGRG